MKCTPTTSAIKRWRLEGQEFKANLSYLLHELKKQSGLHVALPQNDILRAEAVN